MTDLPAALLAVVETALNDQLIDTARAEALDGIRCVLDATRTTADNPPTSGDAADNPAVAAPATAGDGLRDGIAAALIRAGFGEQDASDAAGICLTTITQEPAQ